MCFSYVSRKLQTNTCLADSGETASENVELFQPTVENLDQNRPNRESIVASAGLWRAAATVENQHELHTKGSNTITMSNPSSNVVSPKSLT